MKIGLLLVCLFAVFMASCGSPKSGRSQSNTSNEPATTSFPNGTEFVYISSPASGQVFGFHMDTSSGALSSVPGSPIAGPSGQRGRMFLSSDQTILISIGEGAPSVEYSIHVADGSLTRVRSIDFNDSTARDFVVVAIDASAQFMYAIDGYDTADAHLVGIRISNGSSIPGLGMKVQRVISHPDQRTLYLDGQAFDIHADNGALSRSNISDLPANTGQLTKDGLTLVHQEFAQATSAHIYRRASLTSQFSEVSGSPLVTPGNETFGWYMEPSGTYLYLWNFDQAWYGYCLQTMQPVNTEPFTDFAVVDNTGKFGVQTEADGTLRVQHYDSATGMYGSTISSYSVPPLSDVRFIVGGD